MNRSQLGPWHKLYVRESATFAQLSFLARAVGAQLLKLVDDEGRIECGAKELEHVIAYRMGATVGDRRLLPKLLQELISDGYLVREGTSWRVRNFVVAQSRVPSEPDPVDPPRKREPPAKPTPVEREPDANSRESNASRTRTEREPDARSEPTPRNHVAAPLARTRARSENQKEIQKEKETTDPDLRDRLVELRSPGTPSAVRDEVPSPQPAATPELALEVSPASPAKLSPTQELFDHWRTTMQHPKAVLTDERRRRIATALKTYGLERCKAAVTGCTRSTWHMGDNPSALRYDGLETILRDAGQIEKFEALATAPAPPASVLARGARRAPAPSVTREEIAADLKSGNPDGWLEEAS